MRIAQLITGLAALFFGTPVEATEEDGRARYYSGAEWVLDGDGRVVASSTILVERMLDIPNKVLRTSVVRESPRAGVLPARSTTTLTLVGTSVSPFVLEGLGEREGARLQVVERAARQVLVVRETVRDDEGHTVRVHVLNATPLAPDEYEPWAARLAPH